LKNTDLIIDNNKIISTIQKKGLQEKLEKQSTSLGRVAKYLKSSKINRLPPYLTIHFVRFFWKAGAQAKAKIVRVSCVLCFVLKIYLLLIYFDLFYWIVFILFILLLSFFCYFHFVLFFPNFLFYFMFFFLAR